VAAPLGSSPGTSSGFGYELLRFMQNTVQKVRRQLNPVAVAYAELSLVVSVGYSCDPHGALLKIFTYNAVRQGRRVVRVAVVFGCVGWLLCTSLARHLPSTMNCRGLCRTARRGNGQ
jgi:hypothetical protein